MTVTYRLAPLLPIVGNVNSYHYYVGEKEKKGYADTPKGGCEQKRLTVCYRSTTVELMYVVTYMEP